MPAVVIEEFRVVWPGDPRRRLGPQLYVRFRVEEPVTVKRGVSGYYVDGFPYELVERDIPLPPPGERTPFVYGAYEGPFTFDWPKRFDPLFGHKVELVLVTDKGTFSASSRFYLPEERLTQAGVVTCTAVAVAYLAWRKLRAR